MPVLVVGGYGHLGTLCARELAQTTREQIVIAGASVQRAERTAAALGERASGLYLDAADPRTLRAPFEAAGAVLYCASGPPLAVLEAALETRTAVICASTFRLGERARATLAERSWRHETPVVLHAGAVPGLGAVAAEALVRGREALDELRIASSGPWRETPGARRDLALLRANWKPKLERPRRVLGARYTFPPPLGRRLIRQIASLDLEGFQARNLLSQLTYLEPDERPVARALDRALYGRRPAGFSLSAEAFGKPDRAEPDARLLLQAGDAAQAAAAALGVLVRAVLAGRVPAGLLTPAEALNPALFLGSLAARGVSVSPSPL